METIGLAYTIQELRSKMALQEGDRVKCVYSASSVFDKEAVYDIVLKGGILNVAGKFNLKVDFSISTFQLINPMSPPDWNATDADVADQDILADGIDGILAQRGSTHGNFADNAKAAQEMKAIAARGPGWQKMNDEQREAIHMILHKVARATSGDPHFKDHYDDIAGYAKLAGNSIQ